jgi:hypothetical protein
VAPTLHLRSILVRRQPDIVHDFLEERILSGAFYVFVRAFTSLLVILWMWMRIKFPLHSTVDPKFVDADFPIPTVCMGDETTDRKDSDLGIVA